MSVADFFANSRKISMRMPKTQISRRLANLSYEQKDKRDSKATSCVDPKEKPRSSQPVNDTPKHSNISLRNEETNASLEPSQWRCCRTSLNTRLEIYVSPSSVISGRVLEKDYSKTINWAGS